MPVASTDAWVLATRNAGKLRELRALLSHERIAVIDLTEAGIAPAPDEEEIECYDTFEENALAKARYFSARAGGRVVVADDSGLEVQALDNQPGVRSKRWSGRNHLEGPALDAANNARLMRELADVPDRRAQFVCAAAWVSGDVELVTRGEVPGSIVDQPSGEHGFGYDPHFYVNELGMTMADASVAEKQAVSHRGRAFVALLQRLRAEGRLA